MDKSIAISNFESLGVCKQIAEAASSLGWKEPSAIQRELIPKLVEGKDVVGVAQTGSGKTGAFALPILHGILHKPQPFFALILSPTRELAFQITEQFHLLGSAMGIVCCPLVGGVEHIQQAIGLARKPQILVGTPGRIVDHLYNTKGFDLRSLKHLILDEADRLLNTDFEQEIDLILKIVPQERCTQLYSATMSKKVLMLQNALLKDPVKVQIKHKFKTVNTLQQQYMFIPLKYKCCYLIYLLTDMVGSTTLIFTRTCEATRRISLILHNLGFNSVPIHGKMTQPKRLAAFNKFRTGERSILVATDIASRGLDISQVDLVVNYDVPMYPKDYVHRVGRTARAGRSGRAVTLVTQYDVVFFQKIEELIGLKMDIYPSEEETVVMLLERVEAAQHLAEIETNQRARVRKTIKESDSKSYD
jgi:ATP-dependent RNA helicase DDX47/RRP3